MQRRRSLLVITDPRSDVSGASSPHSFQYQISSTCSGFSLGPLLAANTVALTFFWGKTFTEVALLTGRTAFERGGGDGGGTW